MIGVGDAYRFGFNGQEKDDEVKGNGNSLDYGARIYDPRIARWTALDVYARKYAALSPFAYSANSPIKTMDPNGKEIVVVGTAEYRASVAKAITRLSSSKEGKRLVQQMMASKHKIVIYNNPETKGNKNLGITSTLEDGTDVHEINFNPNDDAPFEVGKGDPNTELERDPSVSLYHELRHSEQKYLGLATNKDLGKLAINSTDDKAPLSMKEVDAVHGENIVRVELGLDTRSLYDGIKVKGVDGVKYAGLGEYDVDDQKDYSMRFTFGDYSSKWKTMNLSVGKFKHKNSDGVNIPLSGYSQKKGDSTTTFSKDD